MTEDQKSNAVMQAFLRIAQANHGDELSDEESKAMYHRMRMLSPHVQRDIDRMVELRRQLMDDIDRLRQLERRLVSDGTVALVLTGKTPGELELVQAERRERSLRHSDNDPNNWDGD